MITKYNRHKLLECLIVIVIIVLSISLSLLQTIVYWLKSPPGTVFPFIHNYISDYYYYLHLMRQGFAGNWLATSWLTSEAFPPQFVNPFFLFLGHLSRITHISLPLMYTLARGIGGIGLIIGILLLSRAWFSKDRFWRTVALAITIFSTGFWNWSAGKLSPPPLVHTWTEFDPMFRLSYIPHHLWSKVFLVLLLFLIHKWHKQIILQRLGVLVILTILMGFTSPVTLVTFIPTINLWFGLEAYIMKKDQPFLKRLVLLTSIILAIAFLVALYHKQIEQSVFPWTSYAGWEGHVQFTITPLTYLQSLGPTAILFLFALPALWRRSLGRLLIAWAVSGWLGAFILVKFVPLSNIRFLEGYQWIPLGIGAAVGIKSFKKPIALLLLCLLPFYFFLGFKSSWQEHASYIQQNKNNPQVYIPLPWQEALKFLEKVGQSQEVVLAPPEMSPLIPAFSGKRVVWAHELMTLNSAQKLRDVNLFYQTPDPLVRQEILKRYQIKYFVLMGNENLNYQLLWKGERIGVYAVN